MSARRPSSSGGRRLSERARAADAQAGHFAENIGDVARGLRVDLFFRDDGDRRRSGPHFFRQGRSGDDDRFAELWRGEKKENGQKTHDDFPPKFVIVVSETAGLLASGSSSSRRLPIPLCGTVASWRELSPVTVAGGAPGDRRAGRLNPQKTT